MITPLVTDLVNLILFFVFSRLVNTSAPLSICLPFFAMHVCSVLPSSMCAGNGYNPNWPVFPEAPQSWNALASLIRSAGFCLSKPSAIVPG